MTNQILHTKYHILDVKQRGFSLVEILIVIVVFAILTAITSLSLALTLRGSRKSENSLLLRSDASYALSVIERHIKSAKSISCPSSTRVDYVNEYSIASYFECVNDGGRYYIASGSANARLTSDTVSMECIFTCSVDPYALDITLNGSSFGISGVEAGSFTTTTSIVPRDYTRL